MNHRYLKLTKLRKHELTAAKAKLKKEYGASAEETYKVIILVLALHPCYSK